MEIFAKGPLVVTIQERPRGKEMLPCEVPDTDPWVRFDTGYHPTYVPLEWIQEIATAAANAELVILRDRVNQLESDLENLTMDDLA